MSKKKGFWSNLFGADDTSSGSANMATERLK
ncbi:MAG: cell division topological specificity factor, partial [Psychrobacter urativorans]